MAGVPAPRVPAGRGHSYHHHHHWVTLNNFGRPGPQTVQRCIRSVTVIVMICLPSHRTLVPEGGEQVVAGGRVVDSNPANQGPQPGNTIRAVMIIAGAWSDASLTVSSDKPLLVTALTTVVICITDPNAACQAASLPGTRHHRRCTVV